MDDIKITLDITKAVENAYLRQLQFKTHNENVQNILKMTNPQTAIDKKIKQMADKY